MTGHATHCAIFCDGTLFDFIQQQNVALKQNFLDMSSTITLGLTEELIRGKGSVESSTT